MSETPDSGGQQPHGDGQPPQPGQQQGGEGGKEIDWKAEARKWETRAKENASAAEQLQQLQEAEKTEIQKAQERAQQLEQELATERVARLRTEIASTKGVPAASLTGSTKEEMEAAADALLEWKGNTGGRGRPGGGFQSGASGAGSGLSGREKAAAALRQLSK